MAPRFVYIHGNRTTHWAFAWAPWLKNELENLGFETFFETMPDSVIARSKYWLPFLGDHVKVSENDILIGWSSGAVAAMRYAENNEILGLVLVSPSHTDGGKDSEKESGYYDAAWDWDRIKGNSKKIAVFYGDDDPYIPQKEFLVVGKELGADLIKIPGGKHFIESLEFQELKNYIVEEFV